MENRPGVEIHPTAIVHPSATIGEETTVGPYAIIEAGVTLGKRCEIQSHVVLRGATTIGDDVKIFPFAVIGAEPQHLKYSDQPTSVVVGDRVTLREYVTIHRGSQAGSGVTRVGSDTFLMAYVHVAHDCTVGNHVTIANATQLAGHVEIGDYANIGGLVGIIQFCRIGKYCFVGGVSTIRKDLPPFLAGKGHEFEVQGVNSVGLSRRGFDDSTIAALRSLYKIFYLQNNKTSIAIEKAQIELGNEPAVQEFIDFVKSSKHGLVR